MSAVVRKSKHVRVIIEGTCCDCCALKITNDDESGCRDHYGHTHPAPSVSGDLKRQADEEWGAPEEVEWIAWTSIVGDDDEIIVGPCDLCGQGDGYMTGWSFAIVR